MSIGMSYDEFWEKDVYLVRVYRKANELKNKRRNEEMWIQGMYIYDALCDVSPLFRFSMKKGPIKPEPYTKEPYPVTMADVKLREERAARKNEERLKAAFAQFAAALRRKMPDEAHPVTEGGEKNVNHD